MNINKFTFVAVILIATNACRPGIEQAHSADTVPIHTAWQDHQCRSDAASIESIQDADALAIWWQPLASRQLPAKPLPQSLGAVDFNESSVFVVLMGQQPTAGYDIELYDDRAPVQRASLTIPANWKKPSPDMMVAQVMTSPCIVITVPADRYDIVTVQDQRGNTLLESHF
jgi:hypothetical protein